LVVSVAVWKRHSEAERWSFLAFALAALGLALSTWFILGSDSEVAEVRWWLVALPFALTALPVLVPRHGVRIAAAALLCVWCFLTGFSIGMLLLPALLVASVAVVKDAR
jgi:hypothetical protein